MKIEHLRLRFILISFLLSSSGISQKDFHEVQLYKTYDDFLAKGGETVGYLNDFSLPLFGSFKLKVDKGEKTLKIKNIWGFKVGDVLFRMLKKKPLAVYSIGELIYYENGIYHLRNLLHPDIGGWISDTQLPFRYYSAELNKEVFKNRSLGELKELNNNLKDLISCIEQVDHEYSDTEVRIRKTRICIKRMN